MTENDFEQNVGGAFLPPEPDAIMEADSTLSNLVFDQAYGAAGTIAGVARRMPPMWLHKTS